jgi:hypothetical protein
MVTRISATLVVAALALASVLLAPKGIGQPAPVDLFAPADQCMACHNRLVAPDGQDVSIGVDWRSSMMAHSAVDPYWKAAVRREILDHPSAAAEIEDECSICHMPMATYPARAAGRLGRIFDTGRGPAATEGVTCSVCHQIQAQGLGTKASFTGGFVIAPEHDGPRAVFGPYEVDSGLARVMRSATGYQPQQSAHIQQSELCATCHTLYTHTRGPDGEVIGELPEQVPYLEWLHSDYRDSQSCQACHMPVVQGETPISSVLGEPRPGLSRHVFRGANFFMLRMLARYATALGVETLPWELTAAARDTVEHLQRASAEVELAATLADGTLRATVTVRSLTGHKLPSAYPSRRAWLHLSVTNGRGERVFESGAVDERGFIAGNDNDLDPARFEPHYQVIRTPDQVQIYEAILGTPSGEVTTGLLTAIDYLKDNRLLPRGFDKATAGADIAVKGVAVGDPDFQGGGDVVAYEVPVTAADGPFRVEAALWYQPIAYRWAHNLAGYEAEEPQAFVRYFESMADVSAVVLAGDVSTVAEAAAPAPADR